jgi:cyanate lyase
MVDLTVQEARALLAEYGAMVARRDEILTAGRRAGLSVTEISQLTGHSRQTIAAAILAQKQLREGTE